MDTTTASAPESAGAELPAKVKVVVVQQAVTEGQIKYLKNQVIEVTPERAAALGDFVKPYVPKEKKPAMSNAPKPNNRMVSSGDVKTRTAPIAPAAPVNPVTTPVRPTPAPQK